MPFLKKNKEMFGLVEIHLSLDDADRFYLAMSQISEKRLTYAKLTGKGTDSLHSSAAGTEEEEPF